MEELKNEIISKAGFLLYTDYWEKYFSKMSGEQIKEAMSLVFHFNKTFEVLETNDLAVDMVVATIVDSLKRDAMKRMKQSIASRGNGKLGGRPRKNKEDEKPKKPKNKKPTLEEVQAYCQERKNSVNPQKWINHYESNGWKVGKNPMKDWKAAVRTWENSEFSNQPKQEQPLEDRWSKY